MKIVITIDEYTYSTGYRFEWVVRPVSILIALQTIWRSCSTLPHHGGTPTSQYLAQPSDPIQVDSHRRQGWNVTYALLHTWLL